MSDQSALTPMVLLPGGTFPMGTPLDLLDQIQLTYDISYRDLFTPEVPQHAVDLAPFYVDVHPVTNAQFHIFLQAQPAWQPERIAPHLHNGDYLKHWHGVWYPDLLATHP